MTGRGSLLLPVALVAAGLLAGACSPPTAPLYRDYGRTESPDDARVHERLAAALHEAGWEIVDTDLPGVVATDERTLRRWGIYRITVSLEAAPVGERHVRVFVHPFRRFVTGGRSKLFALDRGLREAIFPELDAALAERGFAAISSEVPR